ncbi:hypothetical protein M2272_000334 [Mycobacterium frederiksbergense]|uniref:Uncharacterized protein n=1 Tax=Mycolicibacterium frederiksbergense TaxID=117567 RepID=A0ABT6KT09_9MYCO|nr:hypothetical protein [Mycolicibacterium frederiksbergense]
MAWNRETCLRRVRLTAARSDVVRRSGSQRDPDAEQPEAPVVELRVEEWCHPLPVVVERLVVEPALVDATPAHARWRGRWGVPRAATGPTLVIRPAGPSRAIWAIWAALPPLVIGSAGSAGLIGSAWAIRPTRPAGSTGVIGSTRSTRALAVTKRTRRPGFGGRHPPGACRQSGGTEGDDQGGCAGQTLDIHVQLPFARVGYPTKRTVFRQAV